MSRVHKYRAWDEDSEVMYYSDAGWNKAHPESEDCNFDFHEGHVVAFLRQTEPGTIDEPPYDYGEPVDVEQYTGRKDATGKEAYRHDLIKSKHYDGIGEIVWRGNGWAVTVKGDNLLYSLDFEFTIVGTKYEHPHLLK